MELRDSSGYFHRQLELYFPEIAQKTQYLESYYGVDRKPYTCLVRLNDGKRMIFTADPTKQYGMVEELCR